MASIKIADFFASIGIKGDTKQLGKFISGLKHLENSLKTIRAQTTKQFNPRMDTASIKRAKSEVQQLQRELVKLRQEASIKIKASGPRGGGGGGGGASGGGGMLGAGALGAAAGGAGFGKAIGIGAVGFGLKNLIQVEQQFTGIQNALTAATGTVKGGQEEFQFLSETSERLGLNLRQVARGYTNLLASGEPVNFGLENTRELFLGVSESARTLNLSADDTAGVLRAVSQMLSKGTIQSEELKGQLGERLPGAIGIFAKSMGVGTKELFKMLEMGQVLAEDTLPNFAKALRENARKGNALADAVGSNAATMMRMINAWDQLQLAFARGGFTEVVTDIFVGLASAIERVVPAFRALGKVLTIIFRPLAATGKVLGGILETMDLLPTSIKVVLSLLATLGAYMAFGAFTTMAATGTMVSFFGLMAGAVTRLALAFAFLNWPIIVAAAAFLGLMLLIEDVMVAIQGGESAVLNLAKSDGPLALLGQVLMGIGLIIDNAITSIKSLGSASKFFDLGNMGGFLLESITPNFIGGGAAANGALGGSSTGDTKQDINVTINAAGGDLSDAAAELGETLKVAVADTAGSR
jgi:tape measure domain-containing protein